MARSTKAKLITAAAIIMAGVVLYLIAVQFIRSWTPPRDQYPVQGVSVSETNGAITWPNVKALGADFAYLRATAGSDTRDTAFATNMAGAKQTGLRVGAVHEYDLCRLAQDQATNFVTTVPRDPAMLPPVISFGFSESCTDRPARSLVLAELGTFRNQIESHLGKPALLRITPEFEEMYRLSADVQRTIWLIGNFFPPDYGTKPWVMWQANDYYHIEGIEGPVQWNVIKQQ